MPHTFSAVKVLSDNLFSGVTLQTPATREEVEAFLREAKRYSVKKKVEVAPNLSLVYSTDGVSAVWVGERVTSNYQNATDALSEYTGGELFLSEEGENADGENSDSIETGNGSEAEKAFAIS